MKKTRRSKKLKKLQSDLDLSFLEKEDSKSALREFLISSIVIYVLARSREPISTVIGDLLNIEIEAGQILGRILRKRKTPVDLKGYLAGVISHVGVRSSKRERVSSKRQRNKVIKG